MSEEVVRIQASGSTAFAIFDEEMEYYLGNDEVSSFVGAAISWTRCMMNRRSFRSRKKANETLAQIHEEREMNSI